MLSYVKTHGFAAHNRRRTTTATSCGVRLEDIRAHVIANVNGLDKISRTKIYYLMKPARENTRDAARHQDGIDVRVGTKQNNLSNSHPDSHEYFAQKRNIQQFASLFPEEVSIFSCDSKNKVHIGGQAVSRYHQLRTFFPVDDAPNYLDHDFPTPSYLIEPDGCMLLQSKPGDVERITDAQGRDVPNTPTTGPLFVYNRAVKNTHTNVSSHMNDLHDISKRHPEMIKPIVALLLDGGNDWTPKSNINHMYMGRFWRDKDLDMLIAACCPPGIKSEHNIFH